MTNQKPTVESLRTEIAAALPMGSSARQVADFLNERGYNPDGDVDPTLSPRIGRPDEYELPAIIRDIERNGPVSYAITMRFIFDKQRVLKDVEVKRVGTGP